MKLTNALIAAGINPRLLHKALHEALNLQISEDERMERFGGKLSRDARRRQHEIWKLQDEIDFENHISVSKDGKLNLGLN